MPHVEPWASARPLEMRALREAEIARWRSALHWETAGLWATLEHARLDGRLPGAIARAADGTLQGYAYWVIRSGEVHCGAMTANSPAATAALVEAVLGARAGVARPRVVLFAFASAPGLDGVLAAAGFERSSYAYLAAPLPVAPPSDGPAPGRAWDVRDLDATADLLRASYPALESSRPFAPTGLRAEWQQYVGDLVLGAGCGTFRPSWSVAVPGEDQALDGVALVTVVGDGTAHLAQLAVRPSFRKAGLATAMVAAASARARQAGCQRLTLLVGRDNVGARRLYARLGFAEVGEFVSAVRAGTPAAAARVDARQAGLSRAD
ncbi:MAG: GNAT family N-acetyltransferase [Vicinamibacterales bacterium]